MNLGTINQSSHGQLLITGPVLPLAVFRSGCLMNMFLRVRHDARNILFRHKRIPVKIGFGQTRSAVEADHGRAKGRGVDWGGSASWKSELGFSPD